MFRNIIWDVDGTLFDTYPPIAKAFEAALVDVLVSGRQLVVKILRR